jgi:hypothetical protein
VTCVAQPVGVVGGLVAAPAVVGGTGAGVGAGALVVAGVVVPALVGVVAAGEEVLAPAEGDVGDAGPVVVLGVVVRGALVVVRAGAVVVCTTPVSAPLVAVCAGSGRT